MLVCKLLTRVTRLYCLCTYEWANIAQGRQLVLFTLRINEKLITIACFSKGGKLSHPRPKGGLVGQFYK